MRAEVRFLGLGAALVLVAALGAACGDDASSEASEADFCAAYNSLFEKLGAAASEASDEEAVKAMKSWGSELKEAGTPEDIPDDARKGFDLIVDTLEDLDDGATADELDELGEDLSTADEKAAEAFSTYVSDTCPMKMPDLPDMEGELGDLEGEMGDQLDDLESELGELTPSP